MDDGIRPNTTVSDLGRLKPVFKKDGATTAGTDLLKYLPHYDIYDWLVYD